MHLTGVQPCARLRRKWHCPGDGSDATCIYILWWFIPSGVRGWWRQPALPHVCAKLTQLRLRVSLVNAIWFLYFRRRNASVLASFSVLVNGQAVFTAQRPSLLCIETGSYTMPDPRNSAQVLNGGTFFFFFFISLTIISIMSGPAIIGMLHIVYVKWNYPFL